MLQIIVLVIYIVKLRSSRPLPDLTDKMTLEDIQYIYGTLKIQSIQSKAYTLS
jgi:hypothetical protein